MLRRIPTVHAFSPAFWKDIHSPCSATTIHVVPVGVLFSANSYRHDPASNLWMFSVCVCCGRDPSGSLERRARATLRSCCCSFAMHVHAWKRWFVASVRLLFRLDDGTAGRRSHLAAHSHTVTWCAAMPLRRSHRPSATAAARTNVHVSSPLLLLRCPSFVLANVVRACAPRDRAACVMWWNPDSLQRHRRVARRRRRLRHGPVRVVRQSSAYQGRRDEAKCDG